MLRSASLAIATKTKTNVKLTAVVAMSEDGAVTIVSGEYPKDVNAEASPIIQTPSASSISSDMWPELLVSRPGVRPESIKLSNDAFIIH